MLHEDDPAKVEPLRRCHREQTETAARLRHVLRTTPSGEGERLDRTHELGPRVSGLEHAVPVGAPHPRLDLEALLGQLRDEGRRGGCIPSLDEERQRDSQPGRFRRDHVQHGRRKRASHCDGHPVRLGGRAAGRVGEPGAGREGSLHQQESRQRADGARADEGASRTTPPGDLRLTQRRHRFEVAGQILPL